MTYQHALKLFLCFGSSCHGVVIGHALHPVPIASLLHIYIILMVALVSGLVRNRLAYDLPTLYQVWFGSRCIALSLPEC
jgi:hypothetical protein